jgi:hypothetical protein
VRLPYASIRLLTFPPLEPSFFYPRNCRWLCFTFKVPDTGHLASTRDVGSGPAFRSPTLLTMENIHSDDLRGSPPLPDGTFLLTLANDPAAPPPLFRVTACISQQPPSLQCILLLPGRSGSKPLPPLFTQVNRIQR